MKGVDKGGGDGIEERKVATSIPVKRGRAWEASSMSSTICYSVWKSTKGTPEGGTERTIFTTARSEVDRWENEEMRQRYKRVEMWLERGVEEGCGVEAASIAAETAARVWKEDVGGDGSGSGGVGREVETLPPLQR